MSNLAPISTNQSASPFKWMTDPLSNTTSRIVDTGTFNGKLPLNLVNKSSNLLNIDNKLTHKVASNVLKKGVDYSQLDFKDAGITDLKTNGTRKDVIRDSHYEFNGNAGRDLLTSNKTFPPEKNFYKSQPLVQENKSMFTKQPSRSLQSSWKPRLEAEETRHFGR